MSLPSLRLKANADRRLRAGHLWVYSNEIDVAATPLHGFAAGDQAILEAAGGKPLGIVAMSPNNLICAPAVPRHQAAARQVAARPSPQRCAVAA